MLNSLEILNFIASENQLNVNFFQNVLVVGNLNIDRLINFMKSKQEILVNVKFGNIYKIDLGMFKKSGELALYFTNLNENDVLFVKYSKFHNKSIKENFLNIVRCRKLLFTIGEGSASRQVDIDISNFTLFLIADPSQVINRDVLDHFLLKLDLGGINSITSSDPHTEYANQINLSQSELTAEEIYNWRDSQREPNLNEDIDTIISSFHGDQVLSNSRAYINYICAHNDFHEDIERDTCNILVKNDGLYQDLLLEAYLGWNGSGGEINEFYENGISVSNFLDYSETNKDVAFKRRLLFRFLKCFETFHQNIDLFNSNTKKFEKLMIENLRIPKDFDDNYMDTLSNLFRKVCILLSEI
jgi:hypothetical protein